MTNPNRPRVALDILAISQTERGRDVMSWAVGMDIAGIDRTHLDTRHSKPNGELSSAHCVALEINPEKDCPELVRTMERGILSIPIPHILLVHAWDSLALPHVQQYRAKCRLVIALTDPDLNGNDAAKRGQVYTGAACYPTPDSMKTARLTKFAQEIIVRAAIEGVRATISSIDRDLQAEHERRFTPSPNPESGWHHEAMRD